jgi:hypothetical protein
VRFALVSSVAVWHNRLMTNEQPKWVKSPFCGNTTCVEVAGEQGQVMIRDSKNPDQAPLVFDREEWEAFRLGVAAGSFDAV